MDNVIFVGAINESYVKLIELIARDFDPCTKKIILGLKNKSILSSLAEIENVVFLDYNDFYFPQRIANSKKLKPKRFDDESYHLIRDSFIRLFPHYWNPKTIRKSINNLNSYWNSLIIKYNIKILVNLSAVPHFPSDLILEKIATLSEIRIVNFWITGIEGYVHLANTVYGDLLECNEVHDQLMMNNDYYQFLSKLNELKKSRLTSLITPKYKTQKKTSSFVNKTFHVLKIIYYLGFFSTIYHLIRIKIIQNYNYLDSISQIEVNELPDEYIYFPLHYQPEATSLPLAGKFRDQTEIIKFTQKLFPRTVIVIKEHPVQNNFGRTREFLNFVKDNAMVIVIDKNAYNTDILIQNSKLVITATGSSLFEAYIKGKPAIMFGNNIYKLLPNVTHVDSILDINSYKTKNIFNKNFSSDNSYLDYIKKYGIKTNLLLKSDNVSDAEIYETYEQLRKLF